MPKIVPIKDMKNTSAISDMVHSTSDPIFVTKNGYGDMVIMSMETYEAMTVKNKIYHELELSEQQIDDGQFKDARTALAETRAKYGI